MAKIIEGIDANTHIAKITLQGVLDRRGIAGELFGMLGQHNVNVELISTNSAGSGRADISFAVLESYADTLYNVLDTLKERFGTRTVVVDRECALLTVYGSMLSTTPGVAGSIFSLLAQHAINIEMISASLSAISIVVKRDRAQEALTIIRAQFLE